MRIYANTIATDMFFIAIIRRSSFKLNESKTINIIIKENPILKYGIGLGNIFSIAAINEDKKAKNIIS